ncbi:MAG: hydroxymethylbilane synthase [Gammaproteobacteria bacterium]|nr:hydroxymethylbilane synthase [Gammaproteobacteria bacterium]
MLLATLRIATRKSPLALKQARFVQQQLKEQYPHCVIELVEILSTGDKIQDRPLADIGGKGLFVKALEDAILQGKADIAVHSLKDVPPDLPAEFTLAAIGERESPFDVLVSSLYSSLDKLPQGATIGTGSVRRSAQILHCRPDLEMQDIRGNVDTRLKKLDEGQFDALILAAAGLNRLGLQDRISHIISADICLPSVGQGALAIECLSQNAELIASLQFFNHRDTQLCVTAERSMNRALKASCYSPVGSFATIENNKLVLRGQVLSRDGQFTINTQQSAEPEFAEKIGQLAAADLLAQGAKQWLD